ncbi:MAG: alpha-glucosidase [Negativicutes bacterium]|jgi:trehalose-6-phosphate hydrolase
MKTIWWKETVFYELYMPSFCDSNNDGIGDFRGITQKLGYLADLGIKGIWLTPFYPSPKVDNGYDVSDYCGIDSDYGTMDDFSDFINKAHSLGIKVIVDIVINHTSDKHPWFIESRKSKDNPYRDYYIWRSAPNNWESFFSGSAWEFDVATGEYYYHKFAKEQVDLNWTNPKILAEVKAILKFWLDAGVDGFRFDVINYLTCAGITADNPVNEQGEQEHQNDINQQGVASVIGEICEYVRSFGALFTVGEVGSDKLAVLKNYQGESLLDVVFNFNLGSVKDFDSRLIFNEIRNMETELPGFPTLFFSSHDMSRYISRFGETERDIERAKAVAALMLCLKGIPFIYFGDEIGMTDLNVDSINDINDIQGRNNFVTAIRDGKSPEQALEIANRNNRDKSRSPMQWNAASGAGFTKGRNWLKINPNHAIVNVETEKANAASLLNCYKKLINLRNTESCLMYGEYQELTYTDGLIKFVRKVVSEEIVVFVNFDREQKIELPAGEFLLGKFCQSIKKNEVIAIKRQC